ncbi:polysaccharide lyase family protein, partial [uncultured Chitinophaga sp.]|uniref:polysaccharide lyase family protein n=1 Tax=uncultured Chitinophaga sp. TaxID=339340 RepID=UPI0025D0BF15
MHTSTPNSRLARSLRSLLSATMLTLPLFTQAQHSIWEIGKNDHTSNEMALAPGSYKDFLAQDFGWEDRFYLVGRDSPKKDWPYVLPGPKDAWGGTSPTAGIRTHHANILFGLESTPPNGDYKLVIDLLGYQHATPPWLKITVNGKSFLEKLPRRPMDNTITGDLAGATEYVITIPVPSQLLKQGGNDISFTILEGSWLVFDQVKLTGPAGVKLIQPDKVFIRSVTPAPYELQATGVQPLLVQAAHLRGKPMLQVKLDGKQVFSQRLDTAAYLFEVPMPAVKTAQQSRYDIYADGVLLQTGKVNRSPQAKQTPAGYVDTRMGTAHSRWMIAPGPWMPFSMVKLSPDNQDAGWQAGYDPIYESVGTFSHIHEWTMAGLGTLPVNGPLKIKEGTQRSEDDGYRSQIDKSTEKAPLGSYEVVLKDYNIKAELTATTRCSFQRYTYPKGTDSRIMIDLQIPAEYGYDLKDVTLRKVSDRRIEGVSRQFTPNAWSGDVNQDYKVHFVMEFDRPVGKFGTWTNKQVSDKDIISSGPVKDAGAFV